MLNRWIQFCSTISLALFFCIAPFAEAAPFTWTGSGSDNNWSTAANWNGNSVPANSGSIVVFNGTSTKNVTLDRSINVLSLALSSGYTGTITQLKGKYVRMGTGGLTMNAGTFIGAGSGSITVLGNFSLTAGSFKASTGALIVGGDLSITGGTFNSNSGSLVLQSTGTQTVNPGGATFNTVSIDDNLLGYWPLNGAQGDFVADASGNKRYGVLSKSTADLFAVALGGNSATTRPSFSSITAPLSFANSGSLLINAASTSGVDQRQWADVYLDPDTEAALRKSDLTFSTWVKTSGLGNHAFDNSVLFNTKGPSCNLQRSSTQLIFQCATSSGTYSVHADSSLSTINNNAWHQIAAVASLSTQREYLYIDGVVAASGSLLGTQFPVDTTTRAPWLMIGNYSGFELLPFNAYIDDFRVYTKALSAAQIATLAQGYNIASSSHTTTLSNALTVRGDLILPSGTLDVSSSNNALTLYGNWNNIGGTFTARGGTVTFAGSANQSLTPSSNAFYNLTMNKSAGTLSVSAASLAVSGSLLLTSGTFTAPSGLLTLSGNFTNAGTFIPNNGTVVLNGTNQTLSGSTTFWNLRKAPLAAATLTFGSNSNQAVTGMLTLNGASACALLSLRSATPGLSFGLHPSNATAFSFVDLQDTFNTGSQTISASGKDSGNNTHIQVIATTCNPAANVTTTVSAGGGGRAFLAAGTSKSSTASMSSSSSAAQESSSTVPGSTLFSDVPKDAWFASYVSSLTKAGIVSGYKDAQGNLTGQFKPGNNVTQAEILKMALLAAGKSGREGIPKNLSARGDWSAPYVNEAEDLGLSVYGPSLDIHLPATRGQVVQTVLEAFHVPITAGDNPFQDLLSSSPFAAAMETAAKLQIIQGDTDIQGMAKGTVRPNDPINRAEVSKVIELMREKRGK
jgi:hypothetical protein